MIDPFFHLFVAFKAPTCGCELADTDHAGVSITMISVPQWLSRRSCVISDAFDSKLDGGRGVGNKDQVPLSGVGFEEPKGLFSDCIYPVASNG